MERRERRLRPADGWLLAGILAAAAALALLLRLLPQPETRTVTVTVDGNTVAVFPLDTDTSWEIPGAGGGRNLLVIENGTASVTEADCPDKICVRHPAISFAGQSIICLPHRVVVTVTGGEASVDAEVGG